MNPRVKTILCAFIATALWSCNNNASTESPITKAPDTTKVQEKPEVDLELKETVNQEDTARDSFPAEKLAAIRANFKRINSIGKWTDTITKGLSETTEGGEARFYRVDGKIEKIVAQQYGETFHQLTEYFLENGQLSFVYDRAYRYNRPMYYDSASMKENKDTETFDASKATLLQTRSYFDKGKLIHQISSEQPDSGTTAATEQKRILADFQRLQQVLKAKE